MYLGVKAVKPQDDYMLLLTFENDEQGLFDMKPYLDFGPVFRELKEPSMFNSVRVYFDTVSWVNEADLDPEIFIPKLCIGLKREKNKILKRYQQAGGSTVDNEIEN